MATPPDFTAGQVLTAAQMNQIGLWHISRTTIGSAVVSVTISGCFTADYTNYRVIVSGLTSASTGAGLNMTVAGAGATAHYSTTAYYTAGASTLGHATKNGSTVIDVGGVVGTAFDVMNAGETSNNIFVSSISCDDQYYRSTAARIEYTAIPASMTLSTNTGTMTGGFIDVYGYRGP